MINVRNTFYLTERVAQHYRTNKCRYIMIRLRSKMIGCYVPSFFEMHIDTNQQDMTINKLPPQDMTTLFHEYIHFLQDISTYYGLNAIYVYSEYIHSVVNRIYKINGNTFAVPFKISDNEDNVLTNREICKVTLGDCCDFDKFIIDEVSLGTDMLNNGKEDLQSIPSVTIKTNDDEYITFGAMAIMESMAYIMERQCSSHYCRSPEFPYMAAEKLAAYYSSEFASDLLKVLALCDMSLMSSNPGVCFVRVMGEIQQGYVKIEKPEDVYNYMYAQRATINGQEYGLLESFLMLLGTVRECLKKYIVGISEFSTYYQWVDKIYDFAVNWRRNDRYFLLNMTRATDLVHNNYWGRAIHDIGTPLMSNNIEGAYYKIPPVDSDDGLGVEVLKFVREIDSIFEGNHLGCSLTKWCENSSLSSLNELCKTRPWEKVNEQRLCPFALLWRHWNLTGKTPEKTIS